MAKTRPRVFISHASSDASHARKLADRLSAAGLDTSDSTVLPGANVFETLGRALKRADAILVLISPASVKSPEIRREIEFALGEARFEKRLIPILVKPTPAKQIPWILRDLFWAKGDAEAIVEGVLRALKIKPREARAKAS